MGRQIRLKRLRKHFNACNYQGMCGHLAPVARSVVHGVLMPESEPCRCQLPRRVFYLVFDTEESYRRFDFRDVADLATQDLSCLVGIDFDAL